MIEEAISSHNFAWKKNLFEGRLLSNKSIMLPSAFTSTKQGMDLQDRSEYHFDEYLSSLKQLNKKGIK